MLLSTLSQHAGYAEKQLIKTGDLRACASRVIKSRRKLLRLYHGLFLASLSFPVILQFAAWRLSPDRPTMWPSFVTGCLIAMTQLPMLFLLHSSLAKVETIVSLWLLGNTDDTDPGTDNTGIQLAELIASNS